MCIAEQLREQVMRHQKATGEETLVVVVERYDNTIGVHNVGYHPYLGLTVDGRQPAPQWYQQADDFHPLDVKRTLH